MVWTQESLKALHDSPLLELVQRANRVHTAHHKPGEVQCCHLISVKTGGCAEDCSYCAQAARYHTHVKAEPMMTVEEVRQRAQQSKAEGMTRVCLVAAWREVRDGAAFNRVLEMTRAVHAEGLEVCCSLGMLQDKHLKELREAGCYAINHNLDTSESYYKEVIHTRGYQDRLDTLQRVRDSGLSVCCGGILGMGESITDRIALLHTLYTMTPQPESVPINLLVPVKGTPMEGRPKTTVWELLRMVATARIALPKTMLRLSAGRKSLSLSQQALCFFAGANSIHTGEKLLTTPNQLPELDRDLFRTLGLKPRAAFDTPSSSTASAKILPIHRHMQAELEKRREAGTFRTLRTVSNGVDFSSNDYLGFSRSSVLKHKVDEECQKIQANGMQAKQLGATGSRLLTGNSEYVEELEKRIAAYHKGDAALLFNSGYVANLGLLSSIAGPNDTILLDSQTHASTWDGARLSGAKILVFLHNDPNSLSKQLKKAQGRIFVCVEALYSISGNPGLLPEISAICQRHHASLIVDESHSTGIYGPQGRGLVCSQNLESSVFARVHTYGKALGCQGAAIVGSQDLKNFLLNFSRPFIYSTALSLPSQAAIKVAYDFCEQADPQRQQLQRLIQSFRQRGKLSHLELGGSPSPIQALRVTSNIAATNLAEECQQAGLDIRPLLPPTVRRNQECIRVCLHAFNNEAQIDQLFDVLEQSKTLEQHA